MFVQDGTVRLSVLSHTGKEAVVAVLNAGHFFGEGCLAGPAAPDGDGFHNRSFRNHHRRQRRNGAAAPPATRFLGSVSHPHADEEHPDRRRSDRSAVQLEREAARPHAVAAGALR